MADQLPPGPYRMIEIEDGQQVPFYVIPFDKEGHCTGPLTRNHLLDAVQNGAFTDIFLFSHGWNNDWHGATSAYENFLQGYSAMRHSHGLSYNRPFRPLLAGIFWPSIALILPWEQGPAIAAGADDEPQRMDAQVGQSLQETEMLAAAVDPQHRERFYVLAQQPALTEDEALEFARILAPVYAREQADGADIPSTDPDGSPQNLVALWRKTAPKREDGQSSGEGGFVRERQRASGEGGLVAAPQAAGILSLLDPRLIVRTATVLQMKDRAGTVGAHGVGPLLKDMLARNATTRVHLIGHSYGCKVVLSALCFRPLPRPVNSLLLLQPAISYLCFAVNATGTGQPGGYRAALERVEQPILTTFTPRDAPLSKFFHLAVRRDSDLGELQIAGAPPSKYAALGGFGPGGCETDCREITMKRLGEPYDLGPDAPEIYALNAAEHISGHGDISNESTWWALYNQVAH